MYYFVTNVNSNYYFIGKEGVGTRDDAKFLRNIWEVSTTKIGENKKWIITNPFSYYDLTTNVNPEGLLLLALNLSASSCERAYPVVALLK